jgi:hypothetical protein
MRKVHEIENYLLDPVALAARRLNNVHRTSGEIETYRTEAAKRLTWWAACREVIAEFQRRFREPFVPHPPCDMTMDETTAMSHLCNSAWFQKLSSECARTTEPDVRRLLNHGQAIAFSSLNDDTWRVEFAGKEIYRDVGSRICDRSRLHGYHPTRAEFDVDLARDVANSQLNRQRVPQDLVDLLAALKLRITRAVISE